MSAIRGLTAALLGLLACLLVPVVVVSVWVDDHVTDRDEYVDTVAPLADSPVVREKATSEVEAAVRRKFGVDGVASVLLHLAVTRVIDGPEFPPAWRDANRASHPQLLAILDDTSDSGEVNVDLRPVAQQVVTSLGETGKVDTDGIKVPHIPVTVARAHQLEQAQTGYREVKDVRGWAPTACGVVALLTLLIARRRLWAAGLLGFGSALTLSLALVGLSVARSTAVTKAPGDDAALAREVFDILTSSLRTSLLTLIVAALAVGVVLWLLDRVGPFRGRRTENA